MFTVGILEQTVKKSGKGFFDRISLANAISASPMHHRFGDYHQI